MTKNQDFLSNIVEFFTRFILSSNCHGQSPTAYIHNLEDGEYLPWEIY